MKIHSGRVVSGLLIVAIGFALSAPAVLAQQRRAPAPANTGPGMQPPNTAKAGGKIPGNVAIQRIESGVAVDAEIVVVAHDWHGLGLAAGAAVYLWQHNQSRRWYAAGKNAEP